jgi:hypothetical protein
LAHARPSWLQVYGETLLEHLLLREYDDVDERHFGRFVNADSPRSFQNQLLGAPLEDPRICWAADDIVSRRRSASASPEKSDRTPAAAPPIFSMSDVLRSLSLQADTRSELRRSRIAAAARISAAIPKVSSAM